MEEWLWTSFAHVARHCIFQAGSTAFPGHVVLFIP